MHCAPAFSLRVAATAMSPWLAGNASAQAWLPAAAPHISTFALDQPPIKLFPLLRPGIHAESAHNAFAGGAPKRLADGRFLILPHPEVGDYFAMRAGDTDRWLRGMNRMQQRIEEAGLIQDTGLIQETGLIEESGR